MLAAPKQSVLETIREQVSFQQKTNSGSDYLCLRFFCESADLGTKFLSWLFRVSLKITTDIDGTETHYDMEGIDLANV